MNFLVLCALFYGLEVVASFPLPTYLYHANNCGCRVVTRPTSGTPLFLGFRTGMQKFVQKAWHRPMVRPTLHDRAATVAPKRAPQIPSTAGMSEENISTNSSPVERVQDRIRRIQSGNLTQDEKESFLSTALSIDGRHSFAALQNSVVSPSVLLSPTGVSHASDKGSLRNEERKREWVSQVTDPSRYQPARAAAKLENRRKRATPIPPSAVSETASVALDQKGPQSRKHVVSYRGPRMCSSGEQSETMDDRKAGPPKESPTFPVDQQSSEVPVSSSSDRSRKIRQSDAWTQSIIDRTTRPSKNRLSQTGRRQGSLSSNKLNQAAIRKIGYAPQPARRRIDVPENVRDSTNNPNLFRDVENRRIVSTSSQKADAPSTVPPAEGASPSTTTTRGVVVSSLSSASGIDRKDRGPIRMQLPLVGETTSDDDDYNGVDVNTNRSMSLREAIDQGKSRTTLTQESRSKKWGIDISKFIK